MSKKLNVNVSASSVTEPSAFTPLALRADEAAKRIGATTFFIEEIMRGGELPFLTLGKRHVICMGDLIMWLEKERSKQRQ